MDEKCKKKCRLVLNVSFYDKLKKIKTCYILLLKKNIMCTPTFVIFSTSTPGRSKLNVVMRWVIFSASNISRLPSRCKIIDIYHYKKNH